MPYCRANSTAACQSESGNFTCPDCLLRKSSNWRCNCKIGSGVVGVDLRFTISRLRRLTQINNPDPQPSRMFTGNSQNAKEARQAYKCRVRDPWYAVPDVRVPDFFLSYMSG